MFSECDLEVILGSCIEAIDLVDLCSGGHPHVKLNVVRFRVSIVVHILEHGSNFVGFSEFELNAKSLPRLFMKISL